MNYQMLIAFSLGMIVLSATPGPGVLASVAKALSDGMIAALVFISGLVLGDMIFFLLAIIGMSAISHLMGQLFFIIKIAGGIYLIYLGVQTFRNSRERTAVHSGKRQKSRSFVSGLLVTLGNPKPILFYAGVVPTIIDLRHIGVFDILIILIIIAAVSFIVIGAYCFVAVFSKSIVGKKSFQRKTEMLGGIVMIVAGSCIILKKS
jgi:threonine/homoserine/homoserine lactone efflux protein